VCVFVDKRREIEDGNYSISVTDKYSRKVIRYPGKPTNGMQTKAVLAAIRKHLSLIQGPPG